MTPLERVKIDAADPYDGAACGVFVSDLRLLIDAVEKGAALTKQLREVTEHPAFKNLFTIAYVHGLEYRGPQYGPELDASEAALAKLEEDV